MDYNILKYLNQAEKPVYKPKQNTGNCTVHNYRAAIENIFAPTPNMNPSAAVNIGHIILRKYLH